MTCARAGCRTELTPKQIGRGNLYCGQVCGCAIRRVKPVFTATHCANPACGKALTVAQRRSRNPHHSATASPPAPQHPLRDADALPGPTGTGAHALRAGHVRRAADAPTAVAAPGLPLQELR